MSSPLPVHPSLVFLKERAKSILRAHRAVDAACCSTLRHLRRFDGVPSTEILAAEISLQYEDGTFDRMVTTFSMHHWDDKGNGLDELMRITAARRSGREAA